MKLKEFLVILFALIGVDGFQKFSTKSPRFVDNRIFGGEKTKKGDWPWLVAFMRRKQEVFFCGGSLIGVKHVLSGEI